MKVRLNRHTGAFGAVLLLAGAAFFAARTFPRHEEDFSGPGSFPVALSLAMAALALAGLAGTMREERNTAQDGDGGGLKRMVPLGGLTAAYLLLLPIAGFVSATALLCASVLAVLGFRRPVQALATGFLFAFALYWIFGVLMNVALPKGWIG